MKYMIVYKNNRNNLPLGIRVKTLKDVNKKVAWIDSNNYKLIGIKRIYIIDEED